MAIDTLYLARIDYTWEKHDSILLDQKNLNKVLADTQQQDYHTSINDIGYTGLHVAVSNCNQINIDFLKPDDLFNATPDLLSSAGRLLNEIYRNKHKVINFNQEEFFSIPKLGRLVDTAKTKDKHLWSVGCSITSGFGIDKLQSWPPLLASKLNLPLVLLARPGASIEWAADQILRSDINSGDTVVWGITNTTRTDVVKINWELGSTAISEYQTLHKDLRYWSVDYFDSKTIMTKQFHAIMQVINYCNKLNINLYLANMLDSNWVAPILSKYNNFIDLTAGLPIGEFVCNFIDLGDDQLHPGLLQHKKYADILYEFISKSH